MIWLCRKWDYASWDKDGNSTICSRYFKFKNVEIVINRQMIYLGIYENKDSKICNKIFSIENGRFLLDNENDRLIINVIENKNRYYPENESLNGIYVSIQYYEDCHIKFETENEQYFYIMSKYAYDKKGKWTGIIRDDIDNFYDVIKHYRYLHFPVFRDIVRNYGKESDIK